MIIYCATNLLNGKQYIGKTTKTLEARKSGHISAAFSENCKRNKFHNALKKYGRDAFFWEQVEKCSSEEELSSIEIFWIDQLDTFKNGYNSTLGGEGTTGFKIPFSEEHKRKIGEANKKRVYTQATLDKMRLAGLKISDEQRKILSEIAKERVGNKNGMFGKRQSESAKQKMREAWAKRKLLNKGMVANG